MSARIPDGRVVGKTLAMDVAALSLAEKDPALYALLNEYGISIPRMLVDMPTARVATRFTQEAKDALVKAISENQWATAREAYGWLWGQLGLRVSYQTVWRFLNAEGLLSGRTLHRRRLVQPAMRG